MAVEQFQQIVLDWAATARPSWDEAVQRGWI
jgi:hypothetical protein